MSATRKLPHSLTKDGRKTTGGEHLLPQLSNLSVPGFVGVKSGKIHERGYVVYLGEDVTPEMMMESYCRRHPEPLDRVAALRRLEAFAQALQRCKIGNLLSVSYGTDGLPCIKVERGYLLAEPDSRLP